MLFAWSHNNPLKSPAILTHPKFFPNKFDIIAFIIIFGLIALVALGTKGMDQSLVKLQATPILLTPTQLQNCPIGRIMVLKALERRIIS